MTDIREQMDYVNTMLIDKEETGDYRRKDGNSHNGRK